VVNQIHASGLMVGIVRPPRMKGFSPIEVLLEFCRQAPGLHVCGETIMAKAKVNPDEVLSHIERQIVHTLSQNCGSLTVSEFNSVCLRMGLNQNDLLSLSCAFAVYRKVRAQAVWVDRIWQEPRGHASESAGSDPKLSSVRRIGVWCALKQACDLGQAGSPAFGNRSHGVSQKPWRN
jgi:hypothetical protein